MTANIAGPPATGLPDLTGDLFEPPKLVYLRFSRWVKETHFWVCATHTHTQTERTHVKMQPQSLVVAFKLTLLSQIRARFDLAFWAEN
jgi:hypothetical protein